MENTKPKIPKKGAVKRLRDVYEKNRGQPSTELVEILKTPKEKSSEDERSAHPTGREAEI